MRAKHEAEGGAVGDGAGEDDADLPGRLHERALPHVVRVAVVVRVDEVDAREGDREAEADAEAHVERHLGARRDGLEPVLLEEEAREAREQHERAGD